MGLKKCVKCGEDVEQAKAFCPECGNPFVEEKKRETTSEYDNYAGTVNFSDSVFQMVLNDMELDTSNQPKEKKTDGEAFEEIAPPENKSNSEMETPPETKKDKNKFVIYAVIGGIILVILILIIILLIISYIYFF